MIAAQWPEEAETQARVMTALRLEEASRRLVDVELALASRRLGQSRAADLLPMVRQTVMRRAKRGGYKPWASRRP